MKADIIGQPMFLIAEGLAISLLSWMAACLLALIVCRLVPALFWRSSIAARLDFTPDWQVAAYAMILAAGASVVFAIAPGSAPGTVLRSARARMSWNSHERRSGCL